MIAVALAAINLATFAAYGIDKAAAMRGKRRIPESVLHLLGLSGGWPAALVARRIFRHKTKKRAFIIVFWLVAAANLLGLATIL